MTLGALGSGTISSLTYPVDGRDRSANAKIASTAAGAQGRVRGEIRSVLGEGPLSLKKPHDHRSHKGGEQTVLGWRCDDAFAPIPAVRSETSDRFKSALAGSST